jgi:transposase
LFVGHKKAGENRCTLLTLVRSAERCGANPLAYLTDVLGRVQTHPASDLDALLPNRWRPAAAPS